MIFRGAQIHRDGHGKCGLLPKRTLSSNSAELSSSGVLAPSGVTLPNFWPRVIVSNREGQHVAGCQGRNPFHVREQDVWGHLPEVPIRYVIATSLMSTALLLDGLSLNARSRGTNALATMQHYAPVRRMA